MQSMSWDVLSNVIYNNVLVSHSHIPLSLSCGKNISCHSVVKNINSCKNITVKVTTLPNWLSQLSYKSHKFVLLLLASQTAWKIKVWSSRSGCTTLKCIRAKTANNRARKINGVHTISLLTGLILVWLEINDMHAYRLWILICNADVFNYSVYN